MREDLLEQLEKAYPNGFVFYWVDSEGSVRETGYNMDKSKFLTGFYHLGLAITCLTNWE